MFLNTLDLDKLWKIDVWMLSTHDIPCADLTTLRARPLGQPPCVLWKGRQVERQRPPPRPAHEVLESKVRVGRPAKRSRVGSPLEGNYFMFSSNLESSTLAAVELSDSEGNGDIEMLESEPATDIDEPRVLSDAFAAFGLGDDDVVSEVLDEAAAVSTAAAAGEEVQPDSVMPIPLAVLQRPGKWGAFSFSLKQPRAVAGGSKFGGYECLCPFHRKNDKTNCKKFFSLEGPGQQAQEKALLLARHWAVQATKFQTQASHLRDADISWAGCPSRQQLEDLKINSKPATRARTDAEVLAAQAQSASSSCAQGSSRPASSSASRPVHSSHAPPAQVARGKAVAAPVTRRDSSSDSSTSSSSSS